MKTQSTCSGSLGRAAGAAFAILAFSMSSPLAHAQGDVFTDPVGYHTVTIKGGADNFFSMPFPADASDMGSIATVSSNSFTDTNVTWTVNQWQYSTNAGSTGLTYYAQFKSGSLLGVFYTVVSNNQQQLFLKYHI